MLMESNNIQELLNRYWNAETTLEEEALLRSYFSKPNVPEQFRDTAALFRYFEQNKKKELADDAINIEAFSKSKTPKQARVISLFYNSMRIAAGRALASPCGLCVASIARSKGCGAKRRSRCGVITACGSTRTMDRNTRGRSRCTFPAGSSGSSAKSTTRFA